MEKSEETQMIPKDNDFIDYIASMTRSSRANTLNKYYKEHKYCPNCGSDYYVSTLTSVIEGNDASQCRDNNEAFCLCGFKHTVHDRVQIRKDDI